MRIMSQPIDYINKDIEIIKENQIEVIKLESTITKMKKITEGSTAFLSYLRKE